MRKQERFTNAHGDREDYLDEEEFLDGLACLLTRSKGGEGPLRLLGEPLNGSKAQPHSVDALSPSACDFMASVVAQDHGASQEQHVRHLASLEAPEETAISFVRASTMLHSGDPASWRDVSPIYKNGGVARTLKLLYSQLPALLDESVHVVKPDRRRELGLQILKRFVVAHVALEVPGLRAAHLWKASESKHSGEQCYRKTDAIWDVERFLSRADCRLQFEAIKTAVLDAAGGGTEACMAAALEVMLLHVAPQTFYRPIALFLMEQSRDSDRPLTRADFPFIDAYVWERRIGHTLTMLDAKVSRYIEFAMKLKAKKLSATASLKCMLQWGHAAQIVASEFRERLAEDGGGPLCDVWLADDVEEKRALVSRMAVTNACEVREYGARSIAIKRFGISGFPFMTKPPDAATGRGGRAPSLVGYADLSHPELSFLSAIENRRGALYAASSKDGARGLLERLNKPDIKGGGGLVSERTMTHIEPTGMVGGVLEPYQSGGAGTRKAWLFVVALVEFILQKTGLAYKPTGVLRALKTTLEKTVGGETSLARRLRHVAAECEALHGLEDCASFMANTALTGGGL